MNWRTTPSERRVHEHHLQRQDRSRHRVYPRHRPCHRARLCRGRRGDYRHRRGEAKVDKIVSELKRAYREAKVRGIAADVSNAAGCEALV
jgi:hypothetical protein